ncbi:MAG: type II toxin-antitoxin system CcdA family antitoxin [Nitrospirae bacterium]|nr:type II toxin-antitoxin system CcdA family antitoxin [Nitrospirota bacterium]MCL5977664.1 type II toxin-antitoxin system CcdA family antitoxin [Nitrospirota bacterium]
MSLVKTSITIPEDVLSDAKKTSDNFSAFVTEALKEYIKKKNVEKAVASFGKWKDREKSSVEIVKELRKEEGRRYADRHR